MYDGRGGGAYQPCEQRGAEIFRRQLVQRARLTDCGHRRRRGGLVKMTLLCGEQPQSLSLWLSELLEFSCCCCNSLTNVLYSHSGGMLTLSSLYYLKPGVKFHPDLWDFSEKNTERSWRRIFCPVRGCPYVNYKFSLSQNICTVF